MGTKIYVDTCVFLDYYFDRSDNLRPLGELAHQLFDKVVGCKYDIITSSAVITELRKVLEYPELKKQLFPLAVSKKVTVVKITPEEMLAADGLSMERTIPRADCLHALVAHREGCVVVTTDKHFEDLSDYCVSCRPEDL